VTKKEAEMVTMDSDTLILLQQERYKALQREAELLRLLHTQKENDSLASSAATTNRQQNSVPAAWKQIIAHALQRPIRALRPR
jgi:hypothetical protein